ncbi:MAG: acyl-CoA thioesterase [Chlorobi bacterium]|nr:acyl-CoA thioesterase [Chlorobiota bacterium]
MENDTGRFEIGVTASEEDIDMHGHVNNVVYLSWVQDAAIAHWKAIAPVEEHARLLWVVRSHEIEYKKPALAADRLRVQTWTGTASRFAFDRHTEIINAVDGKTLALARTVWCPIDRKTGRPGNVSAAVRALFSVSPDKPSTKPVICR